MPDRTGATRSDLTVPGLQIHRGCRAPALMLHKADLIKNGPGKESAGSWVEFAQLEDISDARSVLAVRVANTPVVLCRVNGTVHAVGSVCPHFNAPMAEGWIEHGRIVCPWHLWEFELESGRCVYAPSEDPYLFYSGDFTGQYTEVRLPIFECKVEHDRIFLHLNDGTLSIRSRPPDSEKAGQP